MSQAVFVLLSIGYPLFIGLVFAFMGYKIFEKKDLV
jgi:ABC-2 type transport system permease protein